MASLAPDAPWGELAEGGNRLLAMARQMGPSKLPPDWVSLKAKPAPAEGFPQEFGYNAVRIPLYLMRAGTMDRATLQPFLDNMTDEQGRVLIVDIASGSTKQALDDAGYRIIPALIRCVLDGQSLPEDLRDFSPTDYYPSTLHLLGLSFARARHPECL